MKLRSLISGFVFFFLIAPSALLAASGDLGISGSSVRFQPTIGLEGKTVRIYATIHNFGSNDSKGVVRFFAGKPGVGKQLQGDQAASVVANGDDIVFVDGALPPGNHEIYIQVYPFENTGDSPTNNTVSKTLTVLQDTDHDGITNSKDGDDDNDGVPDEQDLFPLNAKESKDSDGDGKGDNADEDDDNDGAKDTDDDLPLNAEESKDTDGDGIGDGQDEDDDGDSILDEKEIKLGLDPLKKDTDGDSVDDGKDAFPFDVSESGDYDEDGTGDKTDDDADDDGKMKNEDVNDLNKPPKISLASRPFFILPGKEISLNLSRSSDPDGNIQFIQIQAEGEGTVIEKQIRPEEPLVLAFEKPGSYKVILAATDDKNEISEMDFTLRVRTKRFYIVASIALLVLLVLAILTALHYSTFRRGIGRRPISVSRREISVKKNRSASSRRK